MIRHIDAPASLEGIKKPPRQAAGDGLVKELDQAPTLPPGILVGIEHALAAMIKANTWDSVALSVALSLAYSLVRAVHVSRSTIAHYNAATLWCRAFRGKGKKDGVRRPFSWALVRHGPAGVDFGGHILERWTALSKNFGAPLNSLCFDAVTGALIDYAHLIGIVQRVASALLPDPAQSVMVTTYSFRRYASTFCSIAGTSPPDQVDFGG